MHVTENPQSLPRIVSLEALLLSRSFTRNERFLPSVKEPSPLLGGITQFPPLGGYVMTTAKPRATVELVGPDETPILASWRYGLGRVVAFASGMTPAWGDEWLASGAYARLATQAVRWVARTAPEPGLHVSLRFEGGDAVVTASVRDEVSAAVKGLELSAGLTRPDGTTEEVHLRPIGSGEYEGRTAVDDPGIYRARVSDVVMGSGTLAGANTSAPLSYSAEFGRGGSGGDTALLVALAKATGGRILSGDEPPALPGRHWALRSAWPFFLLCALVLWLIELALRYLRPFAPTTERRRSSVPSFAPPAPRPGR